MSYAELHAYDDALDDAIKRAADPFSGKPPAIKPWGLEWSLALARERLDDSVKRVVEAKARTDANSETYEPPSLTQGAGFMQAYREDLAQILYHDCHERRTARNMRLSKPL